MTVEIGNSTTVIVGITIILIGVIPIIFIPFHRRRCDDVSTVIGICSLVAFIGFIIAGCETYVYIPDSRLNIKTTNSVQVETNSSLKPGFYYTIGGLRKITNVGIAYLKVIGKDNKMIVVREEMQGGTVLEHRIVFDHDHVISEKRFSNQNGVTYFWRYDPNTWKETGGIEKGQLVKVLYEKKPEREVSK